MYILYHSVSCYVYDYAVTRGACIPGPVEAPRLVDEVVFGHTAWADTRLRFGVVAV